MNSIITPTHDPYAAALAAAVRLEVRDLDDTTWHIRHTQDVEAILEANKEDANHGRNRSPSGDMHHKARIPMVVAMEWLNRYGVNVLDPNHKAAVARLLNSNEWAHLRTGGGRIGLK